MIVVERSDEEIADRLIRRRARVLLVLGLFFMLGQTVYWTGDRALRTVDQVKISAWLAWAVVLLIVLASAGGLLRGRKVRALMNDETTRANRLRACAFGFWAASLGAIALYIISMTEELPVRDAIHSLLSLGVGGAIVRFALLERRALRIA